MCDVMQMNDSFDVTPTSCNSMRGTVSGTTSRSRGYVDKASGSVSRTETVTDDVDANSVAGISSVACSRCSYVTECDVSDSVSNVYATTAPQVAAEAVVVVVVVVVVAMVVVLAVAAVVVR